MNAENLHIGSLITTPQQRDAIHIAVVPVEVSQQIWRPAGTAVRFVGTSKTLVERAEDGGMVGVLDPFLTVDAVGAGQRAWLFLLPGSITSLRHDWTHPALDSAAPNPADEKAASEQWLREFIAKADCPGYDDVMQGIQGYFAQRKHYGEGGNIDGMYLHFNGSDAHGEIPREFWEHAEIVLGKKLPHHPEYFSCSC